MLTMNRYKYLLFFWTILIWIGLSIPASTVGQSAVIGFDKVIHVSIFFVWTILFLYSGILPTHRRIVTTVIIGILFSISTELWQSFVIAGREGDIFDCIANTCGVLSAVTFFRTRNE